MNESMLSAIERIVWATIATFCVMMKFGLMVGVAFFCFTMAICPSVSIKLGGDR